MKTLPLLLLPVCLFAQTPPATPAQIGQTATLSVAADGTAPFTYAWQKDGVSLSGATANPLVLTSLKLTDSGAYTAQVTNAKGSTISPPATLTVSAANTMATLTATVTSVNYPPPALYQWRLDGKSVPGATQPSWTFDPTVTIGSISLTVTYPNVQK